MSREDLNETKRHLTMMAHLYVPAYDHLRKGNRLLAKIRNPCNGPPKPSCPMSRLEGS